MCEYAYPDVAVTHLERYTSIDVLRRRHETLAGASTVEPVVMYYLNRKPSQQSAKYNYTWYLQLGVIGNRMRLGVRFYSGESNRAVVVEKEIDVINSKLPPPPTRRLKQPDH